MPSIPDLKILALNDAEASENKIHSDDIAAKYGFTGALVSGVNVFGYLTQPLVKHYGAAFLKQGIMEVIFLKPAYQHDLLTITTMDEVADNKGQRHHLTSATNEDGVLLAKLESWLPKELPAVNKLADSAYGARQYEREEIRWELIHLHQGAAKHIWQPTSSDNKIRVETQRDESDIYLGENEFIHPYYLLDACNKALMRMFILPAWIHTGSRLILRRAIRTGQAIDVSATAIDKWERKNHQFIKLYIAMRVDEEIALEVEHTAIFKIAS